MLLPKAVAAQLTWHNVAGINAFFLGEGVPAETGINKVQAAMLLQGKTVQTEDICLSEAGKS